MAFGQEAENVGNAGAQTRTSPGRAAVSTIGLPVTGWAVPALQPLFHGMV